MLKFFFRKVPVDNDFTAPKRYRQPMQFYLKYCGCLTSSNKYLISAFKTWIHVWKLEEDKILTSWKGHDELIGQLLVKGCMLCKSSGKCLIIIFIIYTSVSSGCEKKVKIWNIETQRCLHVLEFSDNFSNVTFPKISLDKRFLLVSTPNHIELWNGRIVFLICYLMKLT